MLVHLRRSVVLVVIALVLTFAYAFLGTGFSQLAFKNQADGSITANGSTLIGQNWSQAPCPGHRLGTCVFQGRPDAVGPYAGSLKPVAGGGDNPLEANNIPGKPGVLNPGESGASNLGPRSKVLWPTRRRWSPTGRRAASTRHPTSSPPRAAGTTPTSASRTPWSRSRWCRGPRGSPPRCSGRLVISQTQGAELGFLGTSYIDVLQLNEALAKLK